MHDERRRREEEQFALAHEGFAPREVHELTLNGSKFRYLKTDAVQNRLDDVFGPGCWQDHYQIIDDVTVVCTLTVTLHDGRVISRQAPGNRKPETPHLAPTDKGYLKPGDVGRLWQTAFSKALKVAARKFGVGRYLKGPVPHYVQPALNRITQAEPTTLSAPVAEALPPATIPAPVALPAPNPAPSPAPPSFGRRLYNWAIKRGRKADFDLVRHLTHWGSSQGYVGRIVDWSEDEARLGHKEALRRIASLDSQEIPEDAHAG